MVNGNGKFGKIQSRSILDEQNQYKNIQIHTETAFPWSLLIISHWFYHRKFKHLITFMFTFYHFFRESGSNLSNFLNHFKISLYWMYFKIISWLSYVLKYQVVNRCIRHFCLSWLPPCLKMPPIQLKITDCLRIFLCFNKYRAHSSTYLLCICLSRWGNCLVYDYLCDLYSTIYFGFLFVYIFNWYFVIICMGVLQEKYLEYL